MKIVKFLFISLLLISGMTVKSHADASDMQGFHLALEISANGAQVDGKHTDTDASPNITNGTAGATGMVAGASIGYTMAFDDTFSMTIDGQWNPMDHTFKADDAANADDVTVNMDHMYSVSLELNANVTDASAVYAKVGYSEFELEASGTGLDSAQAFDLDGQVYALGTKTYMDNGMFFKSEMGMKEYDNFKLVGVGTGDGTVEADVDVAYGSFAIGMKF